MNRFPRRRALPAFWLWLSLFSCAPWFAAQGARAHVELDDAKRLAADLEFEDALTAFDAALASGTLTRDELVDLLSERALVFHALRRREDLVGDFVWLSALAPDHRLDLRAPPDLVAIWTSVRDQGRGPLGVALVAQTSGAREVEARATLTGTIPEDAAAKLWMRKGGGAFEPLSAAGSHTPRTGVPLAFYAQAVGPGGVVVAQDHTADDPLLVAPAAPDEPQAEGSPSWARRHKAALIAGAAVVVVAAAVLTGVLVAGRGGESERTNLKPMVSF